MKDLFIISDIHGQIDRFTALLEEWDPATQQLILAGDLIDRGYHSLEVVRLAMKLQQEHNAIVLMGNHEELFLEWIDSPGDSFVRQDTLSTIESFVDQDIYLIYSYDEIRDHLQTRYRKELLFLRQMKDFHETNKHIIVHAGIDPDVSDWKETATEDFKWIREDFHNGTNNTGKTIVFGHTPTRYLNDKTAPDRNAVWVSDCKTKIGIDGGAGMGQTLHGLIVSETNGYTVVSVDSDLNRTKKALLI